MAKRTVSVWAIFCLFGAFAAPTSASADPVSVTGGFLLVNGTAGPIELIGESGFSLTSAVSVSGGIYDPYNQCSVPECDPGTVVSLRALWLGNDLTGQLTFDGQTYNDLGGMNSLTQATVEFLGSFIAPPLAASATLIAPFSFGGQFSVPNDTGTAPVTHSLSGAGTATINLSMAFPGDPAWRVDSVRYDFSAADPVPEPGTMLMVGLGIAGVARRVRRARANAR